MMEIGKILGKNGKKLGKICDKTGKSDFEHSLSNTVDTPLPFEKLIICEEWSAVFFRIFFFLFLVSNTFPAGKITEKAIWRSVILTIWHRILNADSAKTPSSSVTF